MKKNYYVFKSGELRRESNTVYFRNEEQKVALPVKKMAALNIFGQIDVNSRLLEFLAQEGVPVHFYNWNDYYSGSYYPRESLQAGKVIVTQAKHYINTNRRMKIATEIVQASMDNMVNNLEYYDRRTEDVGDVIETLMDLEERTHDEIEGIEQLMGLEGKARRTYYSSFSRILREPFDLDQRVIQPPNNPVNAMISFGNSLLYTTILSSIYRTQLNPTISYLHEPRERRFSLSLDVSELFKPVIVDRLIFKLINKQIIQKDCFEEEVNSCLLNDKGRKKFVENYEKKLESTIHHRELDKEVSYQYLTRLECYKLTKHVLHDEPYEGFRMWW